MRACEPHSEIVVVKPNRNLLGSGRVLIGADVTVIGVDGTTVMEAINCSNVPLILHQGTKISSCTPFVYYIGSTQT